MRKREQKLDRLKYDKNKKYKLDPLTRFNRFHDAFVDLFLFKGILVEGIVASRVPEVLGVYKGTLLKYVPPAIFKAGAVAKHETINKARDYYYYTAPQSFYLVDEVKIMAEELVYLYRTTKTKTRTANELKAKRIKYDIYSRIVQLRKERLGLNNGSQENS